MSDPVTNVEIEDVLSSIRRLVSNGAQDRFALPEPDSEPVNRLVLTPSLRVDDSPAAEPSGIASPAAPEDQITSEDEEAREAGDSQLEDAPAEADMFASEHENHDDDEQRTAEKDAARDHAKGDTSADSVEPEGDIWLETAEEADDPVPVESAQAEPAQTAESAAETPDLDDGKDARSDLEAQAAEFEAVVANRYDQWEPDGESGDDYAGGRVTPLSWGNAQDRLDEADEEELSADPDWAEADDVASARHEQDWSQDAMPIPPVEQWGDNDGLSLDDAVLDEEALRDMVSEIVRQELQGALGERITRNVRKLVRREIHRALTSQDMN